MNPWAQTTKFGLPEERVSILRNIERKRWCDDSMVVYNLKKCENNVSNRYSVTYTKGISSSSNEIIIN